MFQRFRDASIKHKLFLGFGSIMAVLTISTIVSYQKVETLKINTNNVLEKTTTLHNQVIAWKDNIEKNLIRDNSIMLVKQDTFIMDKLKLDMQRTSNEINTLQKNISESELNDAEKEQLNKISQLREDYKTNRYNVINKKIALVASTNPDDEVMLNKMIQEVLVKKEKYISSVIDFEKIVSNQMATQQQELESQLTSFEEMFVALTVLSIMLGSIFAYIINKNILTAINKSLKLAQEIKNGNLNYTINNESKDELGQLMLTLNEMSQGLKSMIIEIKDNGEQVNQIAHELFNGNNDLSLRTESQASALEEAAASLEEFTGTLSNTSDHAMNVEHMTQELSVNANTSGNMMGSVIEVMGGIQNSSNKIEEIVSLIDTIAFQTNILALNASIEAARAGQHGRGFAVVASEVRQLSQKTASASKEIKSLILSSVKEVSAGVELVNKTGTNIEKLLSHINEVSQFVNQINNAIKEQKSGINQINEAVSHIDSITQENANLAANNSQASEALKVHAQDLTQMIARFKYE